MSETGAEAPPNYKQTLNLLKTEFPMRGNLSKREPEMLARWENENLRGAIDERHRAAAEAGRRYILHDGPPYANGDIHLGHALNKTLKDIVVRHRTMRGFASPYIPGWDCHGLPIEHQVIKTLGEDFGNKSTVEVRTLCHDYAMKYVDIQREQFKRLGIGGKWEEPYLTLSPEYEAGILEALRDIVAKGHVYRGLKPVFWDPIYRTALAEAELEYHDDEDHSIHVKFPVKNPEACPLLEGLSDPSIVIWTTTPWTLPGNLAVCLHPIYRYAVVRAGESHFVVARELVEPFIKSCGLGESVEDVEIVAEDRGEAFDGLICAHPMFEGKDSVVILGEHVTLETGTGCVHTAPGHGMDDYLIGLKKGLDIFVPVDEAGCFTDEFPPMAGRPVLESNSAICEDLRDRGLLLGWGTIVHSYPHSWRTKEKVIMRATTQWFMRVGDESEGTLRRAALDAIGAVKWIPAWGEKRIRGMMETRPDWCLSRQRSWGVPIPGVICEQCGTAHLEVEVIDRLIKATRERGTDAWFSEPVATWLPEGFTCPECGSTTFHAESDILDVWFDSGASHIACCETHEELGSPVDLYLEGSDQHRGWFQTSLLVGLAAREHSPYREVLTHGWTIDDEGKAMSKSLGNVIAPSRITEKFGADVLRLWVASVDYRNDMPLSQEILLQVANAYRNVRNTLRFLLINMADFDPARNATGQQAMREVDRFTLDRLAELIQRVSQAYDDFEFHRVYHLTHQFCTVDLSALYLDAIKDRLYCEAPDEPARRAAQTVVWHCFETLMRLLAPIIPFTTDEAWQHRPGAGDGPRSVHLADFPTVDEAWRDPELAARWQPILALRGEVTKALEEARAAKRIGKSLEAKVTITADESTRAALASLSPDELSELLIVSQADIVEGQRIAVEVGPADGTKCARCWRVLPSTGSVAKHPGTCRRCADVLDRIAHSA
jgi:isoleucyl-tRNA synthetase